MSSYSEGRRDRPADTVAGFFAALAMAGGLIAVVERPVLIGLFAIFVGFLAAALAERTQRLAAMGVAIASTGWLAGMIVSVITSRPLW